MESEGRDTADNPLLGVILRPTREGILRHIGEFGPLSATRLAKELRLPRSSVAEAVRWLHAKGFIEESGSRRRRGAVERLFRATDSSRWIDDDAWERLPRDQKQRLILLVVRRLLDRLGEAEEANMGDFLPNSCWASTDYVLDERGWSELAAIHQHAVNEAERVAEESRARLASAPEERAIPACSAHFFFNSPGAAS